MPSTLEQDRTRILRRGLFKQIRAGDGVLDRAAREGRDLTAPEKRVLLEKTRAIDDDLEQILRIEGGEAHEFSDTGDGEAQFMARRSHLTAFPEMNGGAGPPVGGGIVTGRTEERTFGRGGRLETRKWSELLSRSGIEGGDWGEWTGEADFFGAIASMRHHPVLKRAQSGIFGSDGGFAIPEPLAAQIFDTSLESEIVRPRAKVFTLTSESLKVPSWDGSDHSSDSLYGGIDADWQGETASLNVKTAKLRTTKLTAKKLALLGRVSTELAEDSPMFAQQFREALTTAAGWHMDNAFLNGDGVKQPEGLLNSPALVTQDKETGQTAATVVWENIINMWSRMWPRGQGKAVWIANHDIIPQLYAMSQAVGTGGVPVYMPANHGAGAPFQTLMGRPILFSEKVPTLGTVGDIGLFDLSQYAIGMRAQVSLMISPHVYFTTDELAFRLRVRVDGKSLWEDAVTPANGANTLSPFVVLATRA